MNWCAGSHMPGLFHHNAALFQTIFFSLFMFSELEGMCHIPFLIAHLKFTARRHFVRISPSLSLSLSLSLFLLQESSYGEEGFHASPYSVPHTSLLSGHPPANMASWFTYYGVLIHLIWRPDSPNSVLVCLIWCPDSWLYTTQLFAWNKFSHATAKVWVWWACASICITFETGVRICPTQPSCIVCIVALIRCAHHRDSAPFSPGSKVTERAPPDEGACSAQGFDSAHLRPEGKPNVWNLQQTRTEVWQYGCVGIGVPNYPLHQAIWCVCANSPIIAGGGFFQLPWKFFAKYFCAVNI